MENNDPQITPSRLVEETSLKILLHSFDWRNLYEENIGEIFEKLERDGLDPVRNRVFSINWSTKGYYKKVNENIETVHLAAFLGKARFSYDIINFFLTPLLLKKYDFSPDIIVVYDFPSVFSGLIAKLMYKAKIAVIVTNIPRNLVRTRRFAKILLLYQSANEALAKHFVDYAIVISWTTKEYVKELGIPVQKIKVFAPNVIARDRRFIESARSGAIREKYDIPTNKKIILSVGRLEREKNFEGLVRAFSDLKDDRLMLVIVGQGSLRDELEALVTALSLGERVIFAGNIDRKEIWNFYRDADVFALLSRSEGLGLVFWEAMFLGVPVIGPHIEGIAESIGEDGLRGFFWDENNGVEDLKKRINKCLEKGTEVREMIKRAEEYVAEKTAKQAGVSGLLREILDRKDHAQKVLYLFNRTKEKSLNDVKQGLESDNHFFGMLRLRRFGVIAESGELEQVMPLRVARFLRKYVLNIHFAHLPLFFRLFRYDVVFSSTAFGLLFIKTLLHIKSPKWVMFDFNIEELIGNRKTVRQKLFHYAIEKCDGIITISDGAMNAMKKMFPDKSQRIEFIHLGTDTNFFKPANEREGDYILCPGRDPGRDYKTLFEAVKDLPIEVRVTAKTEHLAKAGSLPKNIRQFDFSPLELRGAYARAKIIVIPLNILSGSNNAMGCSTLVEAMAMGKAIVATDTNTMRSYIKNRVNGLLVPANNPQALAAAVEELLANSKEREKLGDAARVFALDQCSAEKFASELNEYFKRL